MLTRPITLEEKAAFNARVAHPLQSWEWGEFRKKTGVAVERFGMYDHGELVKGFQLTFHAIPVIGRTLGYLPKGPMPDEDLLSVLREVGAKHNALFIKLEPNVSHELDVAEATDRITKFLLEHQAVPGRPLFTKYTFQLDLTQSEEQLQEGLHSKTRYNINLARRKGVQIYENTSKAGMEQYVDILNETTKRQGFYAHTPAYFRTMWDALGTSGMLRIFEAHYEGVVLASWIMFVFNDTLYYPYGASRAVHREVMASNLLMWEMIRFGKANGCALFDMWGALGPEPDPKHPWFGFHKFKQGYGGQLKESIGTFDLMLDPPVYQLYKVAETVRWQVLRLRAKLKI